MGSNVLKRKISENTGSTFGSYICAAQESSEMNQVREDQKFRNLVVSELCTSSLFLVLQSRTEAKIPTFRSLGSIVEVTQVVLE